MHDMDQLMSEVYDQLREIARRQLANERAGHSLQATALVNEAYLRSRDAKNLQGASRTAFFAAAAKTMRRVLIDHARGRNRDKRGGDRKRITLSAVDLPDDGDALDLIALNDALEQLAVQSQRAADVVELRFFGGLSIDETAEALGISPRTVNEEWAFARAWLKRQMTGQQKPE